MMKPDLDFTKTGGIRLLPLDTASFFLPFGSPVNDYLRGTAGREDGLRRLVGQEPLDFPFEISWRKSTVDQLALDGVDPERESQPALPPEADVEPAPAGFAGIGPELTPRGVLGAQDGLKAHVEIQTLRVAPPKVDSLPLRPRITLAPPPAKLAKPLAAGSKSSPPAKPARPVPAAAAPAAAKPVQAARPTSEGAKPVHPEPAKPAPGGKPGNVVEMERKPSWSPAEQPWTEKTAPESSMEKLSGLKPAAGKAPGENTAEPKTGIKTAKPAPAAAAEKKPSLAAEPAAKPDAPRLAIIPAKPAPLVPPPVVAAKSVETRPTESEAKPPEPEQGDSKQEQSKQESPWPEPDDLRVPSFGVAGLSRRSGGEVEAGFLARIPLAVKIGAVLVALGLGGYFMMSAVSATAGSHPAAPSFTAPGGQGWSSKDAADTVGVRRGRKMQFYDASASAADYNFEFVGAVETKALGWFFRARDTRNYYGMKIEFVRPGGAVLTHFAVIDGRESSYNQRPLDINASPGAQIPVRLEVAGARFSVAIQGQTVEVWTDNRLSRGAVGLMNERDEFGRAGNVQFSAADAR